MFMKKEETVYFSRTTVSYCLQSIKRCRDLIFHTCFKNLSIERHLVLGEHDFIDREVTSEYAEGSSSVTVMKGVAHSPFVEDPNSFRHVVEDIFLD